MPREKYSPPPERKETEFSNLISREYAGQGSQYCGMGKELYNIYPLAHRIYTIADTTSRKVGGPIITDLSFEADDKTLMQTENAQPVIFTHNYVCEQLLIQQGADGYTAPPSFLAGNSLGEYNTLPSSGALPFRNTLELVILRGKLMATADKINPGGLVPIPVNEHDSRLEEALRMFDLGISLINTDNQVIVGGKIESLKSAIAWFQENGIEGRYLKFLPAGGAFHTKFVEPAVKDFSDALEHAPIKKAKIPIIANTTAALIQTPEEIRSELRDQLTHTVLWKNTIVLMKRNGVTRTFEPGNDKGIISKMNERVNGGKSRLKFFPGIPSASWSSS